MKILRPFSNLENLETLKKRPDALVGVLDLDIATVEWMRGASDEAVVVDVCMWLRAASACRLA